MDSLTKLKEYMPKDLPSVSMPRVPTWGDITSPITGTKDSRSSDIESSEIRTAESTSNQLPDLTTIKSGPKSNLDLINECDNFPYYERDRQLYLAHVNTYYGLYVKDHPQTELGYILPSVVETFRGLQDWQIDDDERRLILVTGDNEEERTRVVGMTTQAMRATDHFAVLRGWRDELYPVYGPKGELLFSIERSASPLFGIVTYGCHMTCYTRKKDGGGDGEMKIWVPKRSASKSTYPSMYDNSVAGGISTSETAFESLVRESKEEASLVEDIVRKGAKSVGTVTYFHIRDSRAGGETRLLQPECQYVYDLELDDDVVPKPSDDEVEGFELLSVQEVKDALREGKFKPNCALVLLDFFVRHGVLTAEDEGYIEIVARLHRRLEFPTVS